MFDGNDSVNTVYNAVWHCAGVVPVPAGGAVRYIIAGEGGVRGGGGGVEGGKEGVCPPHCLHLSVSSVQMRR